MLRSQYDGQYLIPYLPTNISHIEICQLSIQLELNFTRMFRNDTKNNTINTKNDAIDSRTSNNILKYVNLCILCDIYWKHYQSMMKSLLITSCSITQATNSLETKF